MIDLSSFQRDCLYVIAGSPDPDYDAIQEALEEYYQSEVIDARLNPNLEELVAEGYLERTGTKGSERYALSETAASALEERRAWEESHLGDLI